jgi:hypothetical protein
MRLALIVAVLLCTGSASYAETWVSREGDCGEWQSRWDVQQETNGVWVGTIDHFQIGGPCTRATGQTLRSEVRAVIAGDNLFAFRTTGDQLCNYVAQMRGENRARGINLCEGQRRVGFVIRFRAPREERQMRDVPPDDDLLTQEQRQQPSRQFQFRGLDELFGR